MLRPSPAINYVAVALFCSRESIPHEKINALPTFNTTYTAHTANTIVNAFPPRNFRGFVAPNPIASKIMFQNEKRSIDVPSDINHFAESSGKKAPRFAAIGLSRSTVPYGFKYKTSRYRTLLTNPVINVCAVIPSEVPKFVFAPPSKLNGPHITKATISIDATGATTPIA